MHSHTYIQIIKPRTCLVYEPGSQDVGTSFDGTNYFRINILNLWSLKVLMCANTAAHFFPMLHTHTHTHTHIHTHTHCLAYISIYTQTHGLDKQATIAITWNTRGIT